MIRQPLHLPTEETALPKRSAMILQTRTFLLIGFGIGWTIGMIWWSVLVVVVFGAAVIVTQTSDQSAGQTISVAERLSYTPAVALPWGIVGSVVGVFASWLRSYLTPLLSFSGMVIGGVVAFIMGPRDGWLALTLPVYSFVGTFVGLIVSVVVRCQVQILKNRFSPLKKIGL